MGDYYTDRDDLRETLRELNKLLDSLLLILSCLGQLRTRLASLVGPDTAPGSLTAEEAEKIETIRETVRQHKSLHHYDCIEVGNGVIWVDDLCEKDEALRDAAEEAEEIVQVVKAVLEQQEGTDE